MRLVILVTLLSVRPQNRFTPIFGQDCLDGWSEKDVRSVQDYGTIYIAI